MFLCLFSCKGVPAVRGDEAADFSGILVSYRQRPEIYIPGNVPKACKILPLTIQLNFNVAFCKQINTSPKSCYAADAVSGIYPTNCCLTGA